MTSLNMQEEMDRCSDRAWEALGRSDFGSARHDYENALALARKLKDQRAEVVFLSYLAEALKGESKREQAQSLLLEAMQIAELENDARLIGHVSYLMAVMACEDSDESLAISLLWRALDSALEAGDGQTGEVSLGRLGEIYRNRGWLEQAAECFRQAAELGRDQSNRIAWLGNLGQTLLEMGDLKGALLRFHDAFQIAVAEENEKSKEHCLASEALVYFEEGELDKAQLLMQEALKMARLRRDLYSESSLLGNLGNVHLRLKEPDIALQLCNEALQIARDAGDRRSQAAHLDSIGDCHLQKGELDEALACYKNALSESLSISDRLGERVYRANQGKVLRYLGRPDEALEQLAAAANLFEEQRARIIQSDSLKTSFAGAGQQIYKDIISLCIETGKRIDAVEYVGRAKSRAMLDLLANSPIDISELENVDDESIARLVKTEFELRSQISALERLFGQAEPETGHRGGNPTMEDVPRLYRQWRDVVDQLRRRHPSYASMVSVDPLNFKDISALWQAESKMLSSKDAIVEFFWSDGLFLSAALWEGLAQPFTVLVSPEEQAELESDLYDFLEMSATEGWEVPQSLCRRLYDRLLADIVEAMPLSIERIIFVPHAILHKLPFAALHDGSKYIIEKYALSVLPSASLIKLLGEKRQNQNIERSTYLISAISDYSATRDEGINFSSRLRSSAGLEDLSYTLEEGKTVFGLASKIVPDAQFLSNQDVKEALLGQFREYSVIHFAGHAVFNPEEPLASGLVLGDGSVLTAARILQDSSFRTDKGKLLILSACQTGVNVITSGGEIVGLARALFYAGMPNLISSLWEVADRSTAQLMQDFHSFWQAGKTSIAEALRLAQRKALADGLPVHAWAPFIHLGID
ncbi:MAG: CHAT domain-containing protein [Candidatus Obscuribacterales bacterium]|nr:CHAT domain-containing protein [Candidatus Obscuribacterales bacterium]